MMMINWNDFKPHWDIIIFWRRLNPVSTTWERASHNSLTYLFEFTGILTETFCDRNLHGRLLNNDSLKVLFLCHTRLWVLRDLFLLYSNNSPPYWIPAGRSMYLGPMRMSGFIDSWKFSSFWALNSSSHHSWFLSTYTLFDMRAWHN